VKKLIKNDRGFTLIEILLVIALLMIIAALVKANTVGLTRSIQLRTAANSIKNQLICAKTRALGDSHVHCGVFFDTTSVPHRVLTFFDKGISGLYEKETDDVYMPPYNLPPGITLSIRGDDANNAIVFRGDGSTYIHGMQLSVTDSNDHEKIISVLPSTGRIKVINP